MPAAAPYRQSRIRRSIHAIGGRDWQPPKSAAPCALERPAQRVSRSAAAQSRSTTSRGIRVRVRDPRALVLSYELDDYTELVARALAEDIGSGDITSEHTIPADLP